MTANQAGTERGSATPVAVVALALLALFLRVAYLANTEVDTPLRADAREYALYASNLVHHGVFSKQVSATPEPDAFRSPGFPLLAAAVLKVSGPRRMLDGVLWLQALLGAAMVPLAYLLARRGSSRLAALAVALLVALSPHLVAACGVFLTETLYAFFLLAALALSATAMQRGKVRHGIVAGALFGCAWATNETALFYPPLVVATALLWPGGGLRAAWRHPARPAAAALLATFALFPAAWSARNALSLGPDALRGSDRALATLTHGTYIDFEHAGDPRTRDLPYRFDPAQPEFASSWSSFARIFAERVRSQPLAYARWYFLGKPTTLWSWESRQGGGDVYIYPVHTSLYRSSPLANATREALRVLHLPLVALAALGLLARAVLRRRGVDRACDGALLAGVVCVAATALFTIFAPWPRYATPLLPELYLCAVSAVYAALRWVLAARAQATSANTQTAATPSR